MAEASAEFIREEMANTKGLKQAYFVFASFIGFQYRQTVETYNYCNTYGVRIDDFVEVFKETNKDVSNAVDTYSPEGLSEMELSLEIKK